MVNAKISLGAIILLAVANVGVAGQNSATISWDNWKFLIGTWKASGGGSPGEGKGSFSFTFDLQNRILVRRSHTDYPETAGRPAFAHDDLMVIYTDDANRKFRADYYDNEG